jgi:hypothetical protein|tara:strand:- start:1115 stop:1288 length:174 start_codon:yes stop_codon:yes gene_type:complete
MREYTVEILETYERVSQLKLKAGNEKLLEERLNDMIEARRRRLGMDEGSLDILQVSE